MDHEPEENHLGKKRRLASSSLLGAKAHPRKPHSLHEGLAEPIRAAATRAPILLTLDDLEDLGSHVTAAANHAKDEKLRKKLDAIFAKIDDLMETHSDEERSKTLKIEDAQIQKLIADQTVALAEWAARMLIGAEQLGIKERTVARFPLGWAERAVLLLFTAVDKKMLSKLETEKPSFTFVEVGGLLMAVAEALLDAPRLHSKALLSIAKSLMTCLEEEMSGAIKQTPKSES